MPFAGKHYRIDGLQGSPAGPAARPAAPRRRRRAAAAGAGRAGGGHRRAQPQHGQGGHRRRRRAHATVEATERKIGWSRDAAGDRFADIELQVRVHLVAVTEDRLALAEALAPGFGLTVDQALSTPHALCGSPGQIAEALIERRERFGISSIGVALDALDALAPVVARLAGT